MISNPFFLLSILTSSLLAFFTTAFVVEMGIRVFSVRKFRFRSLLRLLPFFSLVIDFIFNRFSVGNWLNPLSCNSCVQKLALQLFFPELKNYLAENQISLVRYLMIEGFDVLFKTVFIVFCALTVLFFARKIYQIILTYKYLRALEREGISHEIAIQNPQLKEVLIQKRVRLLVHHDLTTPLTGCSQTIFIPSYLVQILSSDELEAVIAHEMEHVRFRDFIFKAFCQTIGALAWWIPLKSWIKVTEQELEFACDEGTKKYGIQPQLLASAMVKLAKETNDHYREAACYFTDQKKPILLRIQQLLGLSPMLKVRQFWSTIVYLVIGGIILYICIQVN